MARTDGGWTCGGWTATVDGVVRFDGDGGYDDALRVTCAAAWSANELPVIDPALDVLRGARQV